MFIAPKGFAPNPSIAAMNEYSSPYHAMTLAGFNQVTRPNQVYPIYINRNTGCFVKVGKSLQQLVEEQLYIGDNIDFKFDYNTSSDEIVAIWPVTKKGDKCAWRLTSDSFKVNWDKGYIKIIPQNPTEKNQNLFSVQYLADGIIQKIESGELDAYRINENDDIPTLEIKDFKTGGVNITTIWTDKQYYTVKGSTELTEILGEKGLFPYPKPMKLVKDILQRLSKKNSIILDSFAGSGTTAHAVLSLNHDDNGNRKFILIEMMDYAEIISAERVRQVINGYEYKGKKEEEIYSKKLSAKNLLQAETFLKEAQDIVEMNKDKYDKISKPAIKDNCLKVVGTKVFADRMEGLGGSFDFYELGAPLFNKDDTLNEEVGEKRIREYIYYTETREHLTREQSEEYPYLLDYHDGTGYFFYYKKGELTTLSHDTLNIVPEKADYYVIYADTCTISKEQLVKMNISFKKIPRDINRF